jgi:hypothetical protein
MASSSTGTLPEEEEQWKRLPEELLTKVLDTLGWAPRELGAVRGVCRRWRAVHDAACETLRVRYGVPNEVLTLAPLDTICCCCFWRGLDISEGLKTSASSPIQAPATPLFKLLAGQVICALCGRLPALTSLNLQGVQSLTTEGLNAVGGLTTLTKLDLYNCSGVTDAGLKELRHLTLLTHLSLQRCGSVTDAGLRWLHGLAALTELSLYNCHHVTDAGLHELTTLTTLTQISLFGCQTSKAGRDALKAAIPGLAIR